MQAALLLYAVDKDGKVIANVWRARSFRKEEGRRGWRVELKGVQHHMRFEARAKKRLGDILRSMRRDDYMFEESCLILYVGKIREIHEGGKLPPQSGKDKESYSYQ